ncbi:MAG: extracellular elastinolytic metalloproteinase [Saprospiraceae bacterium]|jgi:extracellular elastinolytic metalloproteinase
MKIRFTNFIGIMAFLMISNIAWSQSQTPLDIALRHIENNYKSWNLTQSDIEGMIVSDMYTSKKSGTTHIYFNQSHEGIKLQNAIINVSVLNNGKVNFVGKRFTSDLADQIGFSSASLSTDQALQLAVNDLGINAELPRSTTVEEGNKYTYEGGTISKFAVISELMYKEINNEIQLVWDIMIDPIGKSEKWEYAIDANSSKILDKHDMVIRCKLDAQPFHNHDAHCNEYNDQAKSLNVEETLTQLNTAMTGGYRVFPFTTESPIHGTHDLVTDPDDATASPFGWHDTNGSAGSEFTITRGNNVHAFLDRNDDGVSDGPEPDGGMSLVFDFPFDGALEPAANADAAVTNLFYWTNIIHDFTYGYGFDETSGNYQVNNYGNGGQGSDGLIAIAQANADTVIGGLPGSSNNAFFTPSPDGMPGSVNMFIWDNPGGGNFNVTAPGTIAGQYASVDAGFGAPITGTPVTAEVIQVEDVNPDPSTTDACDELVNADELIGKIALIDRGGCEFGAKALRAQEAGAVAAIICNFAIDPVGMAGGAVGAQVTIPVVMIGSESCATIRLFAGNGLIVSLVTPTVSGPDYRDGDFDNGIIAHECGHGISNRLTGGPSALCLGNDEQMGEGWSDFFGLVMSVKPGDTGDMRRGVGTYALRQATDGVGIRQYPYSTDMNINPHTYENVATVAIPHGVGSIWCATIWDLYWAMVDEYGFDEDQYHGDGGNNRAIWLVMEGMKNQVCQPGFVDGRDAILAADIDLYGGANQCLIWNVFARRGVGIGAEQGSSESAVDQTANFDAVPTCIAELKITKSVTDLVNAGEEIDISIEVINHRDEQLTGVTVTDEMPVGTSYIDGSCSLGASAVTISGNSIFFDLGTMEYLDETTFTYQLATDPANYSLTSFIEDVENVDFNLWFPISISLDALNFWQVSTEDAYTGMSSWYVEDIETESHQIIQGGEPNNQIMVLGTNPVLRFYHNYNTENAADGGVVQISTDGGVIWSNLGDDMFRGEYSGVIQYATFVIPNFRAFYGDSEGWISTYVDLKDYAGQEVVLRWNFATDDNTAPVDGFWHVDDIEIMDLVNYNAEACVTSEQLDEACSTPPGRGTVIESKLTVGINDPAATVAMSIFPNPTDDQVNLSITSQDNQNVTLSIVTLDGKEVIAKNIETSTLTQTFSIDVSALPAGFYFVKASTNNEVVIKKIVIN